jgi:hypothetical protein
VGDLGQTVLFGFAILASFSLVLVALPVVKTSRMVQHGFLAFLLNHQRVLRRELAADANRAYLSPQQREIYRSQLKQCEIETTKMRALPVAINILGVEATAGSLTKFLAAVGGSLLSGLMRSSQQD